MFKKFILPGDKFKANAETVHFHKNMNYFVSSVFDTGNGIVVYVADKYGAEVLVKDEQVFGLWPGAVNLKRQWHARLDYFWDTQTEIAVDRKYNFTVDGIYYEVRKATFLNHPKAIASVEKKRRYFVDDSPRYEYLTVAHFETKQQYYDYMTKELGDKEFRWDFKLQGVTADAMEEIDYRVWANSMQLPKADMDRYESELLKDKYVSKHDLLKDFDSLMAFLKELVFDRKPVTSTDRELIIDIVTLFSTLPPSYGSTAVTKVLHGTGKTDNVVTKPYKAKYNGYFKYDQLFALVDNVETYCYMSRIFVKKEDYGSGTEWRGAFEFIGNKAIDKDKVAEFVKQVQSGVF